MRTVSISTRQAFDFGLGISALTSDACAGTAHVSGSKEMIGAILGLVEPLAGVVLGTLVGSAYGFFATKRPASKRFAHARSSWIGVPSIWRGDAAVARGGQSVDDGHS